MMFAFFRMWSKNLGSNNILRIELDSKMMLRRRDTNIEADGSMKDWLTKLEGS